MMEVRTYHKAAAVPSNFVKDIIGYFERTGGLSGKQEDAIRGWLQKEKNRRVFSGSPELEVPSEAKTTRFGLILPKKQED